jgi:hypothetical protein
VRHYILDQNSDPVLEPDMTEWGRWLVERAHERRVAETEIGDVRVSTVFLGLDHSWDGGDPVLWETMVFGGTHDDYQERYTSRAAAEAGHKRAVFMVQDVAHTQGDAP